MTSFNHPCLYCLAFHNGANEEQSHICQECSGAELKNIRDKNNYDFFKNNLRNMDEINMLGFLRRECVICIMHGILRMGKFFILKISRCDPVVRTELEKRIQTVHKDFYFKLNSEKEYEPVGMDSHESLKIIKSLPNLLRYPNSLLPTWNRQHQNVLVVLLENVGKFLEYLSISKEEEEWLRENFLWDCYVNSMDILAKQVYDNFFKIFSLTTGGSWYFHVLTIHIRFILNEFGSLHKYSTESLELLHSKHRESFLRLIQKGEEHGTYQQKILLQSLRKLYNLHLFEEIRRRFHENVNNKKIEEKINVFFSLLGFLNWEVRLFPIVLQNRNNLIEIKKEEIKNFFKKKQKNVA